MRTWLQRANIRIKLLLIVAACVACQPLFSVSVLAQEGASENLAEVLADISAPTIPDGGMPHNQTKTTKDFSFSWRPSVDSESQVAYTFRMSRSAADLGASETSDAWYSALLNEPIMAAPAQLIDGTWYWQIRAEDEAGNRSAWSEMWNVTLNTQGPVIAISSPLADELIGRRAVSLEAIITEGALASFGVELDGVDITPSLHTVSGDSTVAVTANWPPGVLADGTHSLRVWAVNEVGHESELVRSFYLDTTSPKLSTPITDGQKLKGIVSLELSAADTHLDMSSIEIIADSGEAVVQKDADIEAENSNKLTRIWNTFDSKNGTYRVIFTGRDSAGNETVLQRTVTVMNSVAGVESITKDPLLEELRANLSQPFITPQLASGSASHIPIGALPDISDIEAHPYDPLLEKIPHFTPVVATENGWRLFGILWYWWLLGGVFLGMGGVYSVRLVKRSLNQQLPDSV